MNDYEKILDEAKEKHVAKPQRGHLKDLPLVRTLRTFKIVGECPFKRGEKLDGIYDN